MLAAGGSVADRNILWASTSACLSVTDKVMGVAVCLLTRWWWGTGEGSIRSGSGPTSSDWPHPKARTLTRTRVGRRGQTAVIITRVRMPACVTILGGSLVLVQRFWACPWL